MPEPIFPEGDYVVHERLAEPMPLPLGAWRDLLEPLGIKLPDDPPGWVTVLELPEPRPRPAE